MNKKLWIVDWRPGKVSHQCVLIPPLLQCCYLLVNADWRCCRVDGVPECASVLDSGVHLCLNVLGFAMHTKQRTYRDQRFADVFAYSSDPVFMKKARDFISSTVYKSLKENKFYKAINPIYDLDSD